MTETQTTVRFGYACINTELQALKPRVTCNRAMIKKTFLSKGLPYASQLAEQNTKDLYAHVEWNAKHGVQVFRATSCLFPWLSEYQMEDLPDFEKIRENLAAAGKLARETGVRLSFHPGPFNILASPNESVVEKTIKELDDHAKIFDYMGMPQDHWTKINIHVGGAYGEHEKAMERWCRNFERLTPGAQARLTVENDDRPNLYTTKMLFEGVSKRVGVPIVFDSHHFACGTQDSTYSEAIDMAVSTWPAGVRPTCHHSNSRKIYEDPKVSANAHSDWYYEKFDNNGHHVDVVLECKKKEQALFKYLERWGNDYLLESAA